MFIAAALPLLLSMPVGTMKTCWGIPHPLSLSPLSFPPFVCLSPAIVGHPDRDHTDPTHKYKVQKNWQGDLTIWEQSGPPAMRYIWGNIMPFCMFIAAAMPLCGMPVGTMYTCCGIGQPPRFLIAINCWLIPAGLLKSISPIGAW
jgi:hypothetical protein